MKQRIWELDALRGICLLLMIYCHIVYDLTSLFQLVVLKDTRFYDWAMAYTGIFFLLLSGISVTLGHHPVKRGLVVLLGGMVCSLVTYLIYVLDFTGKYILIYFGILHCIGVCMLLWPIFRKLPFWALIPLGIAVILVTPAVSSYRSNFPLLLPLGIHSPGFSSSDYFPLLPHLGYFFIGSGLGKLLYREKKSLLPPLRFFPINFFCFLGKHSLLVYLLHQPVLAGCIYLFSLVS